MYQRIVVPLDGSELAEKALPEAEQIARLTGAPIHLMRVIDLTQLPWYGQFGMAMEYAAVEREVGDESTAAATYLENIARRFADSGLTVNTEVRRGRAARELVAVAKPGDVIVIATHGRGGITRWFLGSVAEDLLRHSPVPILLIRPETPISDEPASIANQQPAMVNGVLTS
jgi:nucleotide-binding universal stress UspA family protein